MAFNFDGFESSNTTPVPDVLFDVLLPYLNEAKLKVMLYIIRRTLGFKKTTDAISLRQFRYGISTKDKATGEKKHLDNGCGLKNFTTISKALKSLEAMNCIERATAKTDAGDDDTTVYRIKFAGATANVVPTTDGVAPSYAKRSTGTTLNGGRVLRQTEPQETVIQDTDSQETVKQGEDAATSLQEDRNAPIDFEQKKTESAKLKAVSLQIATDYKKDSEALVIPPRLTLQQKEQTSSTPDTDTPVQHSGAHPGPSHIRAGAAQGDHVTEASNGTTKRTRARKPTEKEPPFTLDSQQQAFWELWCNVWFNAEIKPVLTETAYGHVAQLAPYITDADTLNSLIEYTRKDLADSIGMKRKMVQLGNMVHCYAGWKQAQKPVSDEQPKKSKSGLDLEQYGLQAMLKRQQAKAM